MLDSTLDGIILSRTANSQLPKDIDVPSTSSQFVKQSNDSQDAEVRLVVKFTLEEHIVYKGKIQQVNLLDSEELSRVVSKVAWSEGEDLNNSEHNNDNGPHLNDKESDGSHVRNKEHNESLPNSESSDSSVCSKDSKLDQHKQTDSCLEASGKIQKEDSLCKQQMNISIQHNLDNSIHNLKNVKKNTYLDFNDIARDVVTSVVEKVSQKEAESDNSVSIKIQNDIQRYAIKNIQHISEQTSYTNKNGLTKKMVTKNTSPERPFNQASKVPTTPVMSDNLIAAKEGNDLERKQQQTNMKDIDSIVDIKRELESISIDDRIIDNDLTLSKITDIHKPNTMIEFKHEENNIQINAQPTGKRKSGPSQGKRARKVIKEQKLRSSARSSESPTPRQSSGRIRTQSFGSQLMTGQDFSVDSRVFVRWTRDNYFYPGQIDRTTEKKFVIKYYDNASRTVSEEDIISISNIIGKHVCITTSGEYSVIGFVHSQLTETDDITNDPIFMTEYLENGILVNRSTPFKDIFLNSDQAGFIIKQPEKNLAGSNFADVDLDNIIYGRRSRRSQDIDDYDFNDSLNLRKRQSNRNSGSRSRNSVTPTSDCELIQSKIPEDNIKDMEDKTSQGNWKSSPIDSNSNTPNSTSNPGSENVSKVGLNDEFYCCNSSSHRANTSLLL